VTTLRPFEQTMSEMTDQEKLLTAAAILTPEPWGSVLSALGEIAVFVRDFEDQTGVSPLRAPYRKKLLELLEYAELLAGVVAHDEALTTSGRGGTSATVDGLSGTSKSQDLQVVVDRWIVRQRATISADLPSGGSGSKYHQQIRIVLRACQRLLAALDDPHSRVTQTLRCVIAQWVAREGGLCSSKGMYALAARLRAFVSYLEPHQGSDRVSDALGVPRGRLFARSRRPTYLRSLKDASRAILTQRSANFAP
jgi:hypothetical protein